MKKTSNKGFSMVELIIVIAIMAILAAALAPSLIKYINKSRLSTDVTTGTTIATAINDAIAVEKANDALSQQGYGSSGAIQLDTILAASDSFAAEVKQVLGVSGSDLHGKSKKDIAGNKFNYSGFYVSIDQKNNKVTVWYGDTSACHMVSPNPGESMAE